MPRRSLLLLLLGLCAASGCVRVKSYQRAAHAQKTMSDRHRSEAKLDEHVHEYREGSVGGGGGGGGGCGCN